MVFWYHLEIASGECGGRTPWKNMFMEIDKSWNWLNKSYVDWVFSHLSTNPWVLTVLSSIVRLSKKYQVGFIMTICNKSKMWINELEKMAWHARSAGSSRLTSATAYCNSWFICWSSDRVIKWDYWSKACSVRVLERHIVSASSVSLAERLRKVHPIFSLQPKSHSGALSHGMNNV